VGEAAVRVPPSRVSSRRKRRPCAAPALLLLAFALGAASCGSGRSGAGTGARSGPAETAAAPLPATVGGGRPAEGKRVFASAACGSCHKLKAAGASGIAGPSLDETKPSFALVVQRVTDGKGGMPSFRDTLTREQIADIAAFVVAATRG
jgi:mono/diheme cytochrome c family protein